MARARMRRQITSKVRVMVWARSGWREGQCVPWRGSSTIHDRRKKRLVHHHHHSFASPPFACAPSNSFEVGRRVRGRLRAEGQ